MQKRNLSDALVALTVLVCSAVLFAALALALQGHVFQPGGRLIRVLFPDATGIQVSSQVKFGGAPAGTVSGIRILTLEERQQSKNPANLVEVTLSINPALPAFPENVKASISADTLLSDKFVLLAGGSADAAALTEEPIQGTPPTTFDALLREVGDALVALRKIVGDSDGDTHVLFGRIRTFLDDIEKLTAGLNPIVTDAGTFVAEARALLAENRAPISQTVAQLDRASLAIENLANRGNNLIRNNESNLNTTFRDMKIISGNLKVTTVYARDLLQSLLARPQQLIWGPGRRPNEIPSRTEILGPLRAPPENQ
jgi:ABC-type transporter Mla subunit MlaD